MKFKNNFACTFSNFKLAWYFFIVATAMMMMYSFFENKPSEKRKLASKIALEVANTYQKKYGLNFGGISEAAPEGTYQNLGMELYINRKLSKAEGRKILLEIEEEFLRQINSNVQMEKFLLHYPFDGNNIVINIYSRPKNNPDPLYPDYCVFSIFNNELHYSYRKRTENGSSSNLEWDTETKEEALSLISNSN